MSIRRSFVVWALFTAFVAPGCGGSVPAPKAFVPMGSNDGRFACEFPQGWETELGGNTDYSWCKARSGSADIKVDADLAGSLMGDIARAGGDDESGENAPVAVAHEHGKRKFEEDWEKYEERPPVTFMSAGLGEGRRSTFIASSALGGKVFGYRATLLGGDRRINVICKCPPSNWKALKPAFEKVVKSVRTGSR